MRLFTYRLGSGDGEQMTTMNTTDQPRAVACIRFVRRLRVLWTSVRWLRECSIDEDEEGERWQRWETIFAVIKFGMPRRLGEPRFYKWRYDGRPRWNLSLGSTRIQWGCDHEDFYSPNIETQQRPGYADGERWTPASMTDTFEPLASADGSGHGGPRLPK